jgi:hypothetical protein
LHQISNKSQTCPHIMAVTKQLRDDIVCQSYGRCISLLWFDNQITVPRSAPNAVEHSAPVSHCRIPPPQCYLVDADKIAHHEPQYVKRVAFNTEKITLDATSRCQCGEKYDEAAPINDEEYQPRWINAGVYTEFYCVRRWTQIQRCQNCKRKSQPGWPGWIGPDCLEEGLFNWTNVALYSHELLNQYSRAVAESPVTFKSFCNMMKENYRAQGSIMPFPSSATFSKVRSTFYRYRLHKFSRFGLPSAKFNYWNLFSALAAAFSQRLLLVMALVLHIQSSLAQLIWNLPLL